MPLDQARLVIEGVALAGCARHEKLHNAFGARAMMQTAVPLRTRFDFIREQILFAEKLGQSNAAEAASEMPKELAPSNLAMTHHNF
jgi:hypothetical protein